MDLTEEEVVITITKVKYDGEFSHWEAHVESGKADVYLAGTAPTSLGALDMAAEYIYEASKDEEWFEDDANSRSNIR